MTEDASDRIWSTMGKLMHQLLAKYAALPKYRAEQTLETTVHGISVTGTFDLYFEEEDRPGVLVDYKFVSVYTTTRGVKPEWEEQLNLYAHLLRLSGERVSALKLVAIYRDWTRGKAHDPKYPPQVEVFEVKLWPDELAAEFLAERVILHATAEAGYFKECTPAERWEKPTRFALMKEGRKSAQVVCY